MKEFKKFKKAVKTGSLSVLFQRKCGRQPLGAGIYFGSFTTETAGDTFFDATGWGKGVLFVNGNNLGRYWPSVGPQVCALSFIVCVQSL